MWFLPIIETKRILNKKHGNTSSSIKNNIPCNKKESTRLHFSVVLLSPLSTEGKCYKFI